MKTLANKLRSGIHSVFESELETKAWKGTLSKSAATVFDVQDDDNDAGLDTILASTEKILAVNRGLSLIHI